MIRWLFYLITAIFAIGLIRNFIGAIARLFLNTTAGPPRQPPAAKRESPTHEALQKDPVCGMFVAPSTAAKKERNGETYYFCSTECRDKF